MTRPGQDYLTLRVIIQGLAFLLAMTGAIVGISLWVPAFTQASIDRHRSQDHEPLTVRLARMETKLDVMNEKLHRIATLVEVLKAHDQPSNP